MRRLSSIGAATTIWAGIVTMTLMGTPAASAATPTVTAAPPEGIHRADSGYREGYRHGYRDGYQDGLKGCKAMRSEKSKGSGEQGYRDGYRAGFDAGMQICND
jgi:hypothetical protein